MSVNRVVSNPQMDVSMDVLAPNGPTDSISGLEFSPPSVPSDFLAVSSWDKSVRIYEVAGTGETAPRAMYEHDQPALCVTWSLDGSKVVSGGCDNTVRAYDLSTGQSMPIGQHDAPVSCIKGVNVGQPMIASAGWDKQLKYWDLRSPNPISTVQLTDRAYAMDSAEKLLTVATADLHVLSFDLNNPVEIAENVASPLKMQTRDVECMPDGRGWAISSIEGRCAFHFIDKVQQNQSGFSFRCHRVKRPAPKNGDDIYSVNALAFHPTFHTLATAGADGSMHIWDRDAKLRLKYTRPLGNPITSVAFNKTGTLLAYALGYDWSQGYAKAGATTELKVHVVNEIEVKPRPRR